MQNPAWSQQTLLKVGGSLLNWPELSDRLQDVLATVSHPLLLVGGGTAADVVRDWDRIHQLGEEISHAIAMQSLQLTASLLARTLPESEVCTTPEEFSRPSSTKVPIIDPSGWVNQLEKHASQPLKPRWETTSDSIALWICGELGIGELCLLKSADRPASLDWDELAAAGLVDPEFPRLLDHMPQPPEIRWINLRTWTPAAQPMSSEMTCPPN
ncbi:hypothetical protein [Rubinisphaera margarita]|uniref:hypothetical protein n=1 Tax=Rubinisphaera margarita TaxID=2909586 RepID=UPI001EE7AB26|nr:hypothetical protein [Rubinisphaera margarita]MCG6157495.1 hypothetical protein [Rubinisphaera margarita]